MEIESQTSQCISMKVHNHIYTEFLKSETVVIEKKTKKTIT